MLATPALTPSRATAAMSAVVEMTTLWPIAATGILPVWASSTVMVAQLAETVASGEVMGQEELRDVEVAPHRPERHKGQRFAEGLAFGHVILHEAPLAPEKLLSADPVEEEMKLGLALADLKKGIDVMLEGGQGKLAGQSFEVLETYRMFADDRGWNRSLEEAVRTGLTAEAAVDRVRNEHRARFAQARDPYIKERLHDFEDLANRLLRVLAGDRLGERDLPDDAIIEL